MKNLIVQHSLIFMPILLLSYANLVLKWQINQIGSSLNISEDPVGFFLKLCVNPWVLSAFLAGGISLLIWMMALNKFSISYAYPFVSLSFLLVVLGGVLLFGEKISVQGWIGLVLIIMGVSLTAYAKTGVN